MKKLSKFKKQKIEAAEYLSELPIQHFNRFTQQEVALALNKPVLETSDDVKALVKWCLDHTKPIKLNFNRFLVNFKLARTGQKKNHSIDNRVWIELSQNVKRNSKSFKIIQETRPELITELAKIGIMNNILCEIFEDHASIQDPILENPKLFLSEEDIMRIEWNY
jgi:hypothetical protein